MILISLIKACDIEEIDDVDGFFFVILFLSFIGDLLLLPLEVILGIPFIKILKYIIKKVNEK